ncbi:TIGR03086 family metal-binding protein [Kitasatospora aureofaciens]|uniref:TIGR03086 family metal-binding protein n=1 Tax=Kitasatospora aureofaciens TaxID=1894 RepID=UPI001DFF878E|nr:TIGR03086 family metal-binding protein [Kitasatospora aureofaciens]HJD83497.1 TIGR03086 family protein [Kitasatospora aureofaciens]
MNVHPMHPFLARAAAVATAVAAAVPAGARLDAPTPCGEFDTRALINHWVLYTSHGLEHRAHRTELPEALSSRDFTADADWRAAYAAQLERAVAAWGEPAAWEGDVDLGGSPVPAVGIARMLILELVLHGWDVARAVGTEIEVDDELALLVEEIVEENAELYRQYAGFAETVSVPADASAWERALAASGRDPRWKA